MLDVESLVSPTPASELEKHFTHTIKPDTHKAKEKHWERFQTRLDNMLTFANMTKYQEPADSDTRSDQVQTQAKVQTMMNEEWKLLAESVMDAAIETLPRKRVGPKSKAYRANKERNNRKGYLGKLLQLTHNFFTGTHHNTVKGEARRRKAYDSIQSLYTQAADDTEIVMPITSPPQISATHTDWMQWRENVKEAWVDNRRQKRKAKKESRLKDIEEAIQKRDVTFVTDTKSTIASILDARWGKAVIDRVQHTVNDKIVVTDNPLEIRKAVADYFQKWHGPRQQQEIQPGTKWYQEYQPLETIDES
ncbi:hypothetical protein FBU30_001173, partial [Linnemannia zychae]